MDTSHSSTAREGRPLAFDQARNGLYHGFLQNLQQHFRGQLRAQLKPLAAAIGVSEKVVRNAGNIIRINGLEVRPAVINARLTYDLQEVAAALAAAAATDKLPKAKAATAKPQRGRPRKPGLVVQGSQSC